MDYKLHIATAPVVPVSILDARFLTTTKATWSYAANAPNQSLVYAKKQLCDAKGAVVATLSRKAFLCAYDTYTVASPYLQVPGSIMTSVNYCTLRTAYTWVFDDRGSELEMSVAGFLAASCDHTLDADPRDARRCHRWRQQHGDDRGWRRRGRGPPPLPHLVVQFEHELARSGYRDGALRAHDRRLVHVVKRRRLDVL